MAGGVGESVKKRVWVIFWRGFLEIMARVGVVRKEGGKRLLVIDYKGANITPDVAEHGVCMRDVIENLQVNDVDEVVLVEYYERIYDEEQTRMLKEVASVISKFENENVWSPSRLGVSRDARVISERHDKVLGVFNLLFSDPVGAYFRLVQLVKEQTSVVETSLNPEDDKAFLSTLVFMKNSLDSLLLIKKVKGYISQLGSIPEGRLVYRGLFESGIKPSFIGSRVLFTGTEGLELVDEYEVGKSKVYIYKHPERVEFLYYINPPEYTLSPEKYFLLEKTKEVVSERRPGEVGFMDMEQARRYFSKIYVNTISDIAARNGISISMEEREDLAVIVARYTIGYGILEVILSDRQLTDVYVDSPLGVKPVYLVHSKYGQCQTNVVFSEEEARALVSRFRALSGRPFDEAHPILDFDLPDLQTRVAVIGKPLSLDGTAFALRLHKETPWTIPQFLDLRMFDSLTAGLLSFFVDAQASMLIVGSRGSGKTSLLQALMQEIPQNLRIIVQEDTQELPVPQLKSLGFNIERLKTRPPLGGQSEAEVSAEDALRTALRLGDSVLIVGEVRSLEARALYEAMRVGAVGNVVMGTIHGESAYSIWDRVVNDLGVPTTSFKATDFAIVSAPIRFKGSLKRQRRLVEITEVKKEWSADPLREGGFLTWELFNANTDSLELYSESVKGSEWIARVSRNRGLSYEDVWNEISARAASKQFLVDLKNKNDLPQILEASYTIRAHSKYLLLEEKQREEHGSVDYKSFLKEWEDWVVKNLLREASTSKSLG